MPTEWTEMALGELCLKITDGSHSSPPSVPFGKPMASVKDLTPFGLDFVKGFAIGLPERSAQKNRPACCRLQR